MRGCCLDFHKRQLSAGQESGCGWPRISNIVLARQLLSVLCLRQGLQVSRGNLQQCQALPHPPVGHKLRKCQIAYLKVLIDCEY